MFYDESNFSQKYELLPSSWFKIVMKSFGKTKYSTVKYHF